MEYDRGKQPATNETAGERRDEARAVQQEKHRLRMEWKQRILLLPSEYCKEAEKAILGQLFELELWRKAKTIFCYAGTKEEIDTSAVFLRAWKEGKRTGVPLCTGPGEMKVLEIQDFASLTPGMHEILEPSKDCPQMAPAEIDLVLVPGLSFTREGSRLGYGGGYYDRYLPRTKGVKLALCRELQVSDRLPVEWHDQKMDAVLTEDGIFSLNPSRKV